MPDRNADQSKGENDKNNNNRAPSPPAPPSPPDRTRGGNKIYKSGPLFLSSRGIGWTSWKKRWFILTRTSLVFFRTDPSIIPPKGSEVNLTLGGIDLNSSGSVVIKADKKLLTVLFPDGRDGRAFTLKAETSEDLYDWKDALEEALANAPTATLLTGQNGIFRNDQAEVADVFMEQTKERQPVKSLVIGRPILLALEDIDGTPSFLEKALRFIEVHGLKVEGILRQAADVDDVEHRIREYEQGKNEFFPEEDPHVIADCVKYVLRELPSSPVPASCCNALLDAFRTDRGMRVAAMRTAICETFPEPNRRLLQRILEMMQTVASHKSLNRMSTSAVAACMAPLLLRPLLAGDCELENDVDLGDGSVQLLQAAAAANHAQAIIITLLEEYDTFFGEGGSISPGIYSDTEESGSEFTDDDDDDTFEDGDDDDESEGSDADVDEDFEHTSSGTCSETGDNLYGQKGSEKSSSVSTSSELSDHLEDNHKLSSNPQQTSPTQHNSVEESGLKMKENKSGELLEGDTVERSLILKNPRDFRRSTPWGRTPAKKNMESVDFSSGDEDAIQRLEAAKIDLQNKISEEAKGNALLQEDLGKRKSVLHERRLALEQDVARLQEELQKEKELRAILEAGLKMSQGLSSVSAIDEKMKGKLEEIAQVEADVMNLKLKADDLGMQLNQHLHDQNHGLLNTSSNQPQQSQTKDKQKDSETTSTPKMPTRSKGQLDVHLDKLECEKDAKEEALPSQNKHVSTSVEPEVSGKPVLTNSKRTAEGANSTPSTLSKLTNRLNFLKERRSQITNELQNFEKGQNLSQSFEKIRGGFVSMQMDYGFQQSIPESQLVSLGKNNGSISQPLTYDNNIPIKRLVAAATATNAAKSENNQDFEQDRCVFPRKK